MGHNTMNFGTYHCGFFGTGEVDIGTSRDELWDKTRLLFGIMEDDISIFSKVIIWKILT